MLLTKSRYMQGLFCLRCLWHITHEKQEATSASLQFRFDQGNLIGKLAQTMYPEGMLIPSDFKENLVESKKALLLGKPLFEPGFIFEDCYARADILLPVADGRWDLIEVKSSTKAKDDHIEDLAFQRQVYTGAGIPIGRCLVMHINKDFVRHGDVDPHAFFVLRDVSEQVEQALVGITERISIMQDVMRSDIPPTIAIGKGRMQSSTEHECWDLPKGSVFSLHRAGQLAFDLHDQGIMLITDIPPIVELSDKQLIQKKAEETRDAQIDQHKLKTFLSTMKYPLSYLDFETFATAIPLFDGLTPYHAVPFQYSLHIDDGKTIQHREFLATGGDPRKDFIESLKQDLPASGSIVVYSAQFEKRILSELAKAYPSYAPWIQSLLSRVVDLLEPFTQFVVYHPLQEGSCSIKHVLPALTKKSYEGMEIADGEMASTAYVQSHYHEVDQEEKEKTRKALLSYCELDTQAMVDIVAVLESMADDE